MRLPCGRGAGPTYRRESPEKFVLGSRTDERIIHLKQPAHQLTPFPLGHLEGLPDVTTNIVQAFYAMRQGRPRRPPPSKTAL